MAEQPALRFSPAKLVDAVVAHNRAQPRPEGRVRVVVRERATLARKNTSLIASSALAGSSSKRWQTLAISPSSASNRSANSSAGAAGVAGVLSGSSGLSFIASAHWTLWIRSPEISPPASSRVRQKHSGIGDLAGDTTICRARATADSAALAWESPPPIARESSCIYLYITSEVGRYCGEVSCARRLSLARSRSR
jgi:hypothetical protein